jgi:predicted lipase
MFFILEMNNIIINSCILSKIIYFDENEIIQTYRHDNTILKSFNNSNLAVFNFNNEMYFIFRGTKTENDVIINFDLLFDNFLDIPDCLVHQGFYNELMNIKDFIIENLINSDNKKIIFAGHSLGGALAILASLFVVKNGYKNKKDIMCITFGSPRVGNKKFVEEFNKYVSNIMRFVNYGDLIDTLPPTFIGYKHIDTPFVFKNNKLLKTSSQKYNLIKNYNIIGTLCSFIYKNNIMENHSIDLYLINILKNYGNY